MCASFHSTPPCGVLCKKQVLLHVYLAAWLLAPALALAAGTVSLFPVHSRNSFCYVTVDPLRRMVRLWYHAYIPFW